MRSNSRHSRVRAGVVRSTGRRARDHFRRLIGTGWVSESLSLRAIRSGLEVDVVLSWNEVAVGIVSRLISVGPAAEERKESESESRICVVEKDA